MLYIDISCLTCYGMTKKVELIETTRNFAVKKHKMDNPMLTNLYIRGVSNGNMNQYVKEGRNTFSSLLEDEDPSMWQNRPK